VIHNIVSGGQANYANIVQLALDTLPADEARSFVTKVLKETKTILEAADIERLAVPVSV